MSHNCICTDRFWFRILHKVTLSAAIRSCNDWNLTEIIEQAPNERSSLDITDFFNQAIPPHTYLGLRVLSLPLRMKLNLILDSFHYFPNVIGATSPPRSHPDWIMYVQRFTLLVLCNVHVTRRWSWICSTARQHVPLDFYIVPYIIARDVILKYFYCCKRIFLLLLSCERVGP